jgi:broad specificity phosphatase PhoE
VPALLIVRHAQSTWNLENRWQGQANPPLSERGEAQSIAAARRLAAEHAFDLVVSSDLDRARRTAHILADALGLDAHQSVAPGLRELDVGHWSGLRRDEIEKLWPGQLARFDTGKLLAPPGGENRSGFDLRITRAGGSIGRLAARIGAKRVLVVAHSGVIHSMARVAGLPNQTIDFLSGYWGRHDATGLFLEEPVNLLDCQGPRQGHTPEVPSPL